MLARLSRKAGLSRVIRAHMLRHGSARELMRHGEDISTVQRILGHASVVSSQVYVVPDHDRLRAAVAALPPLTPGLLGT